MRKRWNGVKLISLVLLGVLTIGWAGFSIVSHELNSGKKKTIIFVPKTIDTTIEFWQVMRQGVASAAKEFDAEVEVMGTRAEVDVDEQIALLQEAIKKKPEAIILAATDYNRVVPVAKEIVAAGIKLITVDSGLNGGISTSFIGTDNTDAGRRTAEILHTHVDSHAEIAVINFVKESATAMERESGALEILRRYGNYTVLGPFYSNGSVQTAYDIASSLLKTQPNLKAIIGLNEPTVFGIGKAIQDLKMKSQVFAVGIDSSMGEIRMLEDGVLLATVIQKPFNMGYSAVKTAVEVIDGKRVSPRIDTGSKVITKENMYSNENQKLLFPFVE
ncbi:substrate-binding domain-containing protein [Paenibacillus guangzhouensis]|uniref:substrate-binding domain-containing protein n=1 Tax=Paenibacillus guangzhouensis TaxID=1473112 RepID=UPI0012672326|nr:substrate-binding domain-containing protein [Paenibacillus guangzhouensis]